MPHIRTIALLGALLAVLAISALPATAESALSRCTAAGEPSEAKIADCTAVIGSKKFKKASIAEAYAHRSAWKRLSGDAAGALADAEEAVELSPQSALSYNQRGLVQYILKNYEAAQKDFSKAISLNNKQANIFTNRGDTYSALGIQDKAIIDFNRAIELKPDFAHAYNQRGVARFYQGEYLEAIRDYDKAISLDSGQAHFYSNRANAILELNEGIDRAIFDLDTAISLDPEYPVAYILRGDAKARLNQPDAAVLDFSKAIQIDPSLAGAYAGRSHVLWWGFGELDKSIADATKALELEPNLATAFNTRGIARWLKRDYTAALADLTEAIRRNPAVASFFNNRGNVHRDTGAYDLALADYEEAIRLSPKVTNFYSNRGQLWSLKGDPDRAIEDFDRALYLDPDFTAALTHRGIAHARKGDLDAARADFQAAIAGRAKAYNGKDMQDLARRELALLPPADEVAVAEKAAEPAAPLRRVALVIGNGAYASVPPLPNPARDAASVADSLRRLGFETVTVQGDLSRAQFIDALRAFARESESADWSVVYYAGHGIEMGGVNYLIPVDAALAADRDVEFEAISLGQVMNAVERARKLRVVILDACRDNPFAPTMRRTGATRAVARGLARVEPNTGTLVVYAAKDGETAMDGEAGNSPFVTALTRHLPTRGLEINKLLRLVRDDVLAATANRQEPFVYGSLPGEDFFFAGK